MEKLLLHEWLIVEPILSGLVIALERSIQTIAEIAAEVDARCFPSDLIGEAATLANPPECSLVGFSVQISEVDMILRKYKLNNEADGLVRFYDGERGSCGPMIKYLKALLVDLAPRATSGEGESEEAIGEKPKDGPTPSDLFRCENRMGVTLQDAAFMIRPDDPNGQKELVKQWQNNRDPGLPSPIGKHPEHSQQNIYEPTALLKYLKIVVGERADKDFRLASYFRKVCVAPRKKERPLVYSQNPTEPTAKTG